VRLSESASRVVLDMCLLHMKSVLISAVGRLHDLLQACSTILFMNDYVRVLCMTGQVLSNDGRWQIVLFYKLCYH
jgi:hypothetical protein